MWGICMGVWMRVPARYGSVTWCDVIIRPRFCPLSSYTIRLRRILKKILCLSSFIAVVPFHITTLFLYNFQLLWLYIHKNSITKRYNTCNIPKIILVISTCLLRVFAFSLQWSTLLATVLFFSHLKVDFMLVVLWMIEFFFILLYISQYYIKLFITPFTSIFYWYTWIFSFAYGSFYWIIIKASDLKLFNGVCKRI